MAKLDFTQTMSLGDIQGDAELVCNRPAEKEKTVLVAVDLQGDPNDSMSDPLTRALRGSERLLDSARRHGIKAVQIILGH